MKTIKEVLDYIEFALEPKYDLLNMAGSVNDPSTPYFEGQVDALEALKEFIEDEDDIDE